MSKSTKPRRKYRPKPVTTDPIGYSICGAALFMKSQQAKLMSGPNAAFDLLRQGKARNADWNDIMQALTVGQRLCDANIGNNLRDDIEAGMTALSKVGVRMQQTGKPTTCYAAELAAIREALDLYGIQISLCTQGEYTRAVAAVTRFINGLPKCTIEEYMAEVGKRLEAV